MKTTWEKKLQQCWKHGCKNNSPKKSWGKVAKIIATNMQKKSWEKLQQSWKQGCKNNSDKHPKEKNWEKLHQS